MSTSPVNDYLKISRDFITALQSLNRQVEDNPEILFDKAILEEAYKVQSAILRQHFAVLSAMYEIAFPQISQNKE